MREKRPRLPLLIAARLPLTETHPRRAQLQDHSPTSFEFCEVPAEEGKAHICIPSDLPDPAERNRIQAERIDT